MGLSLKAAAPSLHRWAQQAGTATAALIKKLGPDDDRVAVLDSFDEASSKHGQNVAKVLLDQGHTQLTDLRLIQAGAGDVARSSQSTVEALRATAIKNAVSTLDDTSAALEKLLERPGQVRVVNQSAGWDALDETNAVLESVEFRQKWGDELADRTQELDGTKLRTSLGLEASASDRELAQAVVAEVHDVYAKSPEIAQARARYDAVSAELQRRGIVHVIAGSNGGERLASLEKLGVKVPDDLATSLLSNGRQVVVANATTDPSQPIAESSAPSPSITTAALGTGVPLLDHGVGNGASFAAPQVAATIDAMLREQPSLTPEGTRKLLEAASRDSAADRSLEGSGVLDPQLAIDYARLTFVKP